MKRVTRRCVPRRAGAAVSIHTRVKRVTPVRVWTDEEFAVSIHTRVKRVTTSFVTVTSLNKFQSTPA